MLFTWNRNFIMSFAATAVRALVVVPLVVLSASCTRNEAVTSLELKEDRDAWRQVAEVNSRELAACGEAGSKLATNPARPSSNLPQAFKASGNIGNFFAKYTKAGKTESPWCVNLPKRCCDSDGLISEKGSKCFQYIKGCQECP